MGIPAIIIRGWIDNSPDDRRGEIIANEARKKIRAVTDSFSLRFMRTRLE